MKMYKMQTIGQEHTIPVPMNGENRYIKFIKVAANNPFAYYSTDDAAVQKAIEGSKMFESGEIAKMGEETELPVGSEQSAEEPPTPKGEKQLTVDSEQTADNNPELEEQIIAVGGEQEQLPVGSEQSEEEPLTPEGENQSTDDSQPTTDENPEPGVKATEYPDVTTFQQAKEILSSEPYKVAKIVISTPPKILKKAAELGVLFPNLKAVAVQ